MPVLFRVENLSVTFDTQPDPVAVVDDVSFSIRRGETMALVGESGCGKSVTALAALGLLDPPGRVIGGDAFLESRSLLSASDDQLRAIRGQRISMIFQEPMTSLNPVFSVGNQICEALLQHTDCTKSSAREQSIRLLDLVGIPDAATRVDQYPHELSGGMKQRAMIAMALSCEPDLLIADEPTTALDVTIQSQILELLDRLQQELGMAILLITHNLGVVAQVARDVVVMYAGRVVEQAPVEKLFREPRHPYTQGLLASLPIPGKRGALQPIAGNVPNPRDYAAGCRFCTRCPHMLAKCITDRPEMRWVTPEQGLACWFDDTNS